MVILDTEAVGCATTDLTLLAFVCDGFNAALAATETYSKVLSLHLLVGAGEDDAEVWPDTTEAKAKGRCALEHVEICECCVGLGAAGGGI